MVGEEWGLESGGEDFDNVWLPLIVHCQWQSKTGDNYWCSEWKIWWQCFARITIASFKENEVQFQIWILSLPHWPALFCELRLLFLLDGLLELPVPFQYLTNIRPSTLHVVWAILTTDNHFVLGEWTLMLFSLSQYHHHNHEIIMINWYYFYVFEPTCTSETLSHNDYFNLIF